jgi:hypothetical protein
VMEGFQAKGTPRAARAAWYTPKLRRKPRTAEVMGGRGQATWMRAAIPQVPRQKC